MKLRNSITTVLIFIITAFYITAHYAQTVTWGGIPLQAQLFLVGKLPLGNNSYLGVFAGQWWRVFTVVLTHASWEHIGFNMIAFFQLGNLVERFYGRSRYIVLLIVSALLSSLLFLLLVPADQPSVGASGMIFGIFGAMLVSGKKMGIDYQQLVVWIVINLLITFTGSNIAWQAHMGGFAAGVGLALIFHALPRRATRQSWE